MLLTVGRVVRPHGVHGEVVVAVRTDEPQDRYAAGVQLIAESAREGPQRLTVARCRPHQGRLIVIFEGVHDRDGAEALRGVLLQVDSETVLPLEDPEEFHDHQLVGLTAVTTTGERLGEVVRIDHAPAADLLVVERPGGGTTFVPFVTAIVPEVDLGGGRLVVDPPPGLLDL